MEEPELLTPGEVAELKKVHLKSVYRAISEERLPFEKRYGRIVIPRAVAEAWQPWHPLRRARKAE